MPLAQIMPLWNKSVWNYNFMSFDELFSALIYDETDNELIYEAEK